MSGRPAPPADKDASTRCRNAVSQSLARARKIHRARLTRVRAGPTCVRQLADWGANVIKIELPPDPEAGEGMGGAAEGSDFQNLHRNKRSMTLNLKSKEVLRGLQAHGEEGRCGGGEFSSRREAPPRHRYPTLARINPSSSTAAFPVSGKAARMPDGPGFDQIAQGMGGLMSITGLPGQGPVRVGIPIADLCAGLFCALGILVALLSARSRKKANTSRPRCCRRRSSCSISGRALVDRGRGTQTGRQ